MTGSALALAACGSNKVDPKAAAEHFNASDATGLLQTFVQKNGAISSCRIADQGSNQSLLTVIAKNGDWLQTTIDPKQPLGGDDVTVGGDFPPKTAQELSTNGRACKVSAAFGSISVQ